MSYTLAHTVFDADDDPSDILHDLLTDQWCEWIRDDGSIDWDALSAAAAAEGGDFWSNAPDADWLG